MAEQSTSQQKDRNLVNEKINSLVESSRNHFAILYKQKEKVIEAEGIEKNQNMKRRKSKLGIPNE